MRVKNKSGLLDMNFDKARTSETFEDNNLQQNHHRWTPP